MDISLKNELFGNFVSELARKAPDYLKPLIFACSLSVRDPELMWELHPDFENKSFLIKLLHFLQSTAKSLIFGAMRVMLRRKTYFYRVLQPGASLMILAPIDIVSIDADGRVKTNYIQDESQQSSWCVFANRPFRQDLSVKSLSLSRVFRIQAAMIALGLKCFCLASRKRPLVEALIHFLNWALSCHWIHHVLIAEELTFLQQSTGFSTLMPLLEMHPFSRIAAYWAFERKIPAVAIQHATITSTKFWYFSTKAELSAGLRTPTRFFVYNEATRTFLRPYYPETHFDLGCSQRFIGWRTREIYELPANRQRRSLLLVASLSWYDLEILLDAAEKILKCTKDDAIVLRLHPATQMTSQQRKRLLVLRQEARFSMSSRGSLQEDLEESYLVLGMGSTVLLEALLMRKAVLFLKSDRFTFFDQTESFSELKAFTVAELNADVLRSVSLPPSTQLVAEAREILGLSQPLVTVSHALRVLPEQSPKKL